MTDDKLEREPRPEVIVEAHQDSLVGGFVLWSDDITDQLPFSVSTISLMEGLQADHPELEIHEEQLEALDAIQEAQANSQKRALVHMATGLGKTTVVAANVKRFLANKPKARVLFLCHQNDILAQARERFEQIVGGDYTYGNFTGESQDYHEVTCLFASFQAMANQRGEDLPKREQFLQTEFDYVVVDESHHGKAPTYEPTLDYFDPEFMVGLTGTPDRHDLKDIRDIFGDEIYRLPLEEAIARGLLSPVDYHVITDEIADTSILRDATRKRLNYRQLDRTIFIPKRDEEIVRIIHEKAEELDSPKRIVFCKSIEQTEEYAQYFSNAAPLHSKLPKHEQDKYISQFRNGEIDTVLTVDMFNEGIDIPDANQVIFLRSTQSKTIFLQQLGRGLRKIPGKDLVQVLDFVANCDRLTMLDEVWREITSHALKQAGTSRGNALAELIRIDIGKIHFSDMSREILDILSEIETRSALYRSWSSQNSIGFYLKVTEEKGKPATLADMERLSADKQGPPVAVLLRAFGGKINNLKRAAGIQVDKVRPPALSDEELILVIQNLAESLGRSPIASELKTHGIDVRPYRQRYGNWPSALRAAGLEQVKRNVPYTADEMIKALQALATELGRTPLSRDLRKRNDIPSPDALVGHFGSYNNALLAAGLTPNRYVNKTGRVEPGRLTS